MAAEKVRDLWSAADGAADGPSAMMSFTNGPQGMVRSVIMSVVVHDACRHELLKTHQKLLCTITRFGGLPNVLLNALMAIGILTRKFPFTPDGGINEVSQHPAGHPYVSSQCPACHVKTLHKRALPAQSKAATSTATAAAAVIACNSSSTAMSLTNALVEGLLEHVQSLVSR